MICSFFTSFILDGIAYCFGIFLNDIKSYFGSSTSSTSLANSLLCGMYLLVGKFYSILSRYSNSKRNFYPDLLMWRVYRKELPSLIHIVLHCALLISPRFARDLPTLYFYEKRTCYTVQLQAVTVLSGENHDDVRNSQLWTKAQTQCWQLLSRHSPKRACWAYIYPQRILSLEFPEICGLNLICYHWLYDHGNCNIMDCGIVLYLP